MMSENSGYKIKTSGRSSFRTIDIECPKCDYHEERTVDMRGALTDDECEERMRYDMVCPNCGNDMERVWRGAPTVGKLGKDGSATSVAALQQSFKERFVKKEIDDVRHKHGKMFDDSLRGAAVNRIKKDL